MSYAYVAATILLTAYGQIAIKWRVLLAGALPVELGERVSFLAKLLFDPWIISALLAALLAAVSWMAAMTKLQLSHAYPFMSFTFVLVLVMSGLVFHEPINAYKMLGMALIVVGIVVGSLG